MLIGNDFKIEKGGLDIIVSKKTVSKKDSQKIGWRTVGYFGSLHSALRCLADEGVRDSGLTDMKTIVAKQAQIHKLISEIKVVYEKDLAREKNIENNN